MLQAAPNALQHLTKRTAGTQCYFCSKLLVVFKNDVAGRHDHHSVKPWTAGRTTQRSHLRVPRSVDGAAPWGPCASGGPGAKLVDEAAR